MLFQFFRIFKLNFFTDCIFEAMHHFIFGKRQPIKNIINYGKTEKCDKPGKIGIN